MFLIGLLISLSISLDMSPALATKTAPKIDWIEGERVIPIGEKLATLNLPKQYRYANAADTAKLMEYLDNPVSSQDIGLVMPNSGEENWFVVFSFSPIGYVKDDESQSIDKDAILEKIKEATEEDNKRLQAKGIPPMTVTGWQEPPHYDPKTHNLVWAITVAENGSQSVNYNTRKLGRDGVTSINLVASPKDLAVLKPKLEKLVANYSYVDGKKYTDFVVGKDKAAEIGLTALIAGGAGAAAAKTGIFAKIFLFLVVGLKKLWIFLVVIIGGFAKQMFSGKKSEDANPDKDAE
jgi:uncharacterized membrane-anchored protein